MPSPDIDGVRVCPRCGFSHLRSSRARSILEQGQAWWSRTAWFRCETCGWRGRVRDVWNPDGAFPDLPPLRLGRDLDIERLQERDEESIVDLVLSRKDDLHHAIRVWLDDSRPAPAEWLRVTSVHSAQRLLSAQVVREISLDYDLGWCADCFQSGEHLKHSGRRHCPHTLTGYDLVNWMAETGQWPLLPPNVHSGNLDGGARMLGLIARYWRGDTLIVEATETASDSTADSVTPRHAPIDLGPPTERPPSPATSSTTLTICPNCHGPHIYRTHRHSNFERLRTLVTRRHPVRCGACGWTRWISDPILVRFSANGDVPTSEIDSDSFERIEPGAGAGAADPTPRNPSDHHAAGQ